MRLIAALDRPIAPTMATALAFGMVAVFSVTDLLVPGEINVPILYGLAIAVCAWTRSVRILSALTGVCVILAFIGLRFDTAPTVGPDRLNLFWLNYVLVAVELPVMAGFVHCWIRHSERLREFTELLQSKNETLTDDLCQARKMEAIGQLTDGITHDFKNLLTVIVGNLELMAIHPGDEARRQRLIATAAQAAQSAAALAHRILAFARPPKSLQPIQLDQVIRHLVSQWQRTLGTGIKLSAEVPAELWPCRLDPVQFETALLNLALNAREAIPDGGRLTIRAENVTVAANSITALPAGDYVLVSVADSGPGIPADITAKLFNPFFTTKSTGSGLGLWMVRNFATASGGEALLDSVMNRGTTVRLYFPRG